jgi:carboxymethylenebutenolidase
MYKSLCFILVFVIVLSISNHVEGSLTVMQNLHVASPLQQAKMNISIDKIQCPDNLQIIMKKSDGEPACVKLNTIPVLIERGWGIHVLPNYTTGTKNSDLFDGGSVTIKTDSVNYFENTTGFLARPSQEGNYPGVILIHEWWGLNDNIKSMARGLASHGYVVLAVDLYGGQVATTSDGARQLLLTFNQETGISNIDSAVKFLKQNYNVDKIATIGWCFGGSQSLNYALSGNKLDATVIYYGQPVTNATKLSAIKWPVLGFYGDKDQNFPVDTIKEFQSSLNSTGIENEIYIYPGLGHAFANPSGTNYAPQQTIDAWDKTLSFLEKYLK